MTFKEYINQTVLKRRPAFSVNVTEQDATQVIRDTLGTIVILKCGEHLYYSYLVRPNSQGALYSMDSNGNLKNASVFNFVEN